ncbi:MAG: hypothetical protein ACK5DG_11755 [Chitinophagaceae bacterium]
MKQIQELIKLVNKSNLSEVSIEQKDFKITIKQKEEVIQQAVFNPAVSYARLQRLLLCQLLHPLHLQLQKLMTANM